MISVVTVNFNAGTSLIECARAVLGSRGAGGERPPELELIVVDNGSSDGSIQGLRAELGDDPRLAVVENGANLGFARANNIGLARARGGYVAFVNPDCVVAPDAFAQLQLAMDARPDAGMGGCLVLNPDGTEQAGCRRMIPTPRLASVRALGLSRLFPGRFDDFVLTGSPLPPGAVEVEAISGAFMFVRRSAIDRVGPLDEGYFLHCEDLDWCLRFLRAGYSILFVPQARAVHEKGRCGRDRRVRVLWHLHAGMIRFYRKFYRRRRPAPYFWLIAGGVGARFAVLAALAWLRHGRASR